MLLTVSLAQGRPGVRSEVTAAPAELCLLGLE